MPISILDRANVRVGNTEADALQNTIDRARRADELGYHRFWVAEHHGVPGIAGSAPAVLMAALASRTENIRIGSGGVMLPNHQPLVVAEQFATLEALFPGRIDLGLGRSVGFTPAVRTALRQDRDAMERFEADLGELSDYLGDTGEITARPRNQGRTPLFVLATGEGVEIAARAGLPVVVGGPAVDAELLDRYRSAFTPSGWAAAPYVIASATVMVATSTEAAEELLLPEAWAMARSRTQGEFRPLQAPEAIQELPRTDREQSYLDRNLASSIAGTPEQVLGRLDSLINDLEPDELLITGSTFDVQAQRESDALLLNAIRSAAAALATPLGRA